MLKSLTSILIILFLMFSILLSCKNKKKLDEKVNNEVIDSIKEEVKIDTTTTAIISTTSTIETTTTIESNVIIEEKVVKKPIRKNKKVNKKVSVNNIIEKKETDKIEKYNGYVEIDNTNKTLSNKDMREYISYSETYTADLPRPEKVIEEPVKRFDKLELIKRSKDKDGKLVPMTDEEWETQKDITFKKYGIELGEPDNINNYKTIEEKKEAIKKVEDKFKE